jgi:hypothetical protein
MPIDAQSEKRIVLVDMCGTPDQHGTRARVVDTYLSHFATCPDAKEHRRR